MWTDDGLINLLDRRFELASGATGRPFLLECRRLLQWLASDMTLAAYVGDLLDALKVIESRQHGFLNSSLVRITDISTGLLRDIPALDDCDDPKTDPDLYPLGYEGSFRKVSRSLERLRLHLGGEELDDELDAGKLLGETISRVQARISDYAREHEAEAPGWEAVRTAVVELAGEYRVQLSAFETERQMSPGWSLMMLGAVSETATLRAEGERDGIIELVERIQAEPALARAHRLVGGVDDTLEQTDAIKGHLRRVQVELCALLGSSLSHRRLFARFKARSVWYDKKRLRELVLDDRGEFIRDRETVLVEELARYLFDHGVWAILKVPFANHEVDLLGPLGRPLLVEGKVHKADARGDIVQGVAQLHAYMTSLEGTPLHVKEAHYVVFRLGGPLYELPLVVETNRFRIYPHTIDLGDAADSGRHQPKPEIIRIEELLAAVSS